MVRDRVSATIQTKHGRPLGEEGRARRRGFSAFENPSRIRFEALYQDVCADSMRYIRGMSELFILETAMRDITC